MNADNIISAFCFAASFSFCVALIILSVMNFRTNTIDSFQVMSIQDMRRCLKELAKLLAAYQRRVPSDDLLALSNTIEKSKHCKLMFFVVCHACVLTCCPLISQERWRAFRNVA